MKRHYFKRFSLKIVKEESALYNVENKIRSAKDIAEICYEVIKLHEEPIEKLIVFYLNTKNVVNGYEVISQGTLNSSLIHPREVFKGAIINNANCVIMVHNHPSGDVEPSNADKQITKVIKEAGKLLQIDVLDHIIIGIDPESKNYYSLKDNRIIDFI